MSKMTTYLFYKNQSETWASFGKIMWTWSISLCKTLTHLLVTLPYITTMQDIKLCENFNILAKVNAISVHLPFVTPNNHINWTLTAPAGCHDFVVHWGSMLQRGEEKGRATEDLVFENTLSSHLSSSQRKTCRCNVVVKCAAEILIREKWVGCSPSGWLQPCWLSVGEKTLCMKVGLYADDGLTWNWCIAISEYDIYVDLHFLLCLILFVFFLLTL